MTFFLFPNVQNRRLSYKSFTYHNLEVDNSFQIPVGKHNSELAWGRTAVNQRALSVRHCSKGIRYCSWPGVTSCERYAPKQAHALFLSGNGIAVCPSTVLLACLSSSLRLSIKNRATPAASRCATASSHSFLAARRHCWLRFKQASSKSPRLPSEQLKRYSIGGNLDIWPPVVLVCRSTWWAARYQQVSF